MKPLILIIEDEQAQAQILQYNLEAEGYRVKHAPTADEGLLLIQEYSPDLILLDWMLPDMSGIEVCRQIKANPDAKTIPVIMLTARGTEDDKVRGLGVGADDYVVKPHSIKELIARIKANLRKAGIGNTELTYGGVIMNTETHRVSRDDQNIKLGPTEFRLLKVFLERPQKVWSRAALLDHVWGTDIYVDERTVDVHIGRLRKALNTDNKKDLIRTIRSAGYALDVEE
ncbi:MAG: phosphate regulon transcriptional regulatory protein PhoB [Robiginitomaculum sp.]|nr:MAG: phosphate regulon transcriptional regulatory protein PhoB [Robiginitomaculum sp.]